MPCLFSLPVSKISNLCAKILVHLVWPLLSQTRGKAQAYVYLKPRKLSILSTFLRLSTRLSGTSRALWAAQAIYTREPFTS